MTLRLASAGAALLLAAACAPRPATAPAATPAPRVVVVTAAGARLPVTVELARSDEERTRGLMYRRELAPEAGMLFFFAESEERAFWMKNTLIPLDMLFIDDGGRVVGLIERAEPLTTSPRDPGVPCRYVLEVNGGWAARHGVRPGDRVEFENVPRF
jgi:uncharacterized membrane protein (UPF0127 family)